ncbi:MAG: lysozyme [Methylococcaceae bacterium]
MFRSNTIIIFSFILFSQLTGCAQKNRYEVGQFNDALTAGIFWEGTKTRALIPEGTILEQVYPAGIKLTKESEGFRNNLYNDAAGFCTIGYGHLIKKQRCNNTEKSEFIKGITESRGEEILVIDMNWAKYSVMNAVSVDLTQGQYAALVDFVFNVGSGNFNKSTLLRKINKGDHANVPFQLRRWIRAGGKVFQGLVTRREREINLYLENTSIPRLLPRVGEELPDIDIRVGEAGS